jgi:hypothetical protein
MDIVLISTCDMQGGRPQVLQRMIASVAEIDPPLRQRVRLFLLLQRCSNEALAAFAGTVPEFVKLDACPGRLSLSAARNRLLSRALDEPLAWQQVLVAFPDDDAWYPAGTLEAIVKEFASDERLDFWFCRYSSAPVSASDPSLPPSRSPSLSDCVRRGSSNTIFLRGDVAKRIGGFDENLGVGTKNGSAEDTDVAIKALALARRSAYLDAAAVGHRDPNPALRGPYYRGTLVTLARYAGVVGGVYREFIRKLAIGCYLILSRDITPRQYLSSVRNALAELGRGKL